jgi:transposase
MPWGRMATVAKRYPRDFKEDVVRVARRREVPLSQIARDFGISDATFYEWMRRADIEDGVPPGMTEADATEILQRWSQFAWTQNSNAI